jgi:Raf kinase inhibitor-like YbhB/YbcL family protein
VEGRKDMSLKLTSTAFAPGAEIPKQHTGDGADISPPLAWQGTPVGTKEFAIVCDDPDAPSPQPWVHWLVYKIPAQVNALPENMPIGSRVETPTTAFQGRNSWSSGRTIGYRGPAPPPRHGVHHYHFKLYALATELNVNPGIDKHALLQAMEGHVLAEAELVGLYHR